MLRRMMMAGSSATPVAPVVLSITQSNDTAAGLSHMIQMPDSVNAGDLLIAIIGSRSSGASSAAISAADGWTRIVSRYTGVGLQTYGTVLFKVSNGTEGGSVIDFPSGNNTISASSHVWRIASGSYSGSPQAADSPDSGANMSPQPPPLSPGWPEAALWICGFASNGSAAPLEWPLSDNRTTTTAATPDARRVVSCSKIGAGTGLVPGAFTMAANTRWASFTVALRAAL